MLQPHGSPSAKLWLVLYEPFSTDTSVIADGGLGFVLKGIYEESGLAQFIPWSELYITCMCWGDADKGKQDNEIVYEFIKNSGIESKTPPFLLVVDERTLFLLYPETKKRKQTKIARIEGSLDKWAGSLLSSPFLSHPHYIVGTYGPQFIMGSYWYRDIAINIDLGHLRDDLSFYLQHGHHNPLPQYKFTIAPPFRELIEQLQVWYEDKSITHLSDDIETIRTVNMKESIFRENNGMPYLLGFAPNEHEALSFCLADYTPFELVQILRLCDKLTLNKRTVGQNYFNFDSLYKRAMGFRWQGCWDRATQLVETEENPNPLVSPFIEDTLIKHHLLWVELPHDLGFLTRQYTRQPYYKDESSSFNPKNRTMYAGYHCKDMCVTYKVNTELDKELVERGLL
jgi:hypothetical protein